VPFCAIQGRARARCFASAGRAFLMWTSTAKSPGRPRFSRKATVESCHL
jgi:hypothetical protein